MNQCIVREKSPYNTGIEPCTFSISSLAITTKLRDPIFSWFSFSFYSQWEQHLFTNLDMVLLILDRPFEIGYFWYVCSYFPLPPYQFHRISSVIRKLVCFWFWLVPNPIWLHRPNLSSSHRSVSPVFERTLSSWWTIDRLLSVDNPIWIKLSKAAHQHLAIEIACRFHPDQLFSLLWKVHLNYIVILFLSGKLDLLPFFSLAFVVYFMVPRISLCSLSLLKCFRSFQCSSSICPSSWCPW